MAGRLLSPSDPRFKAWHEQRMRYRRIDYREYLLSPARLFDGGAQGAWYDPSDLSTLYQDAAGTTPVTSSGDPVGLMLDKSGNGNHATQSVSVSRPTYQTDGALHWLEFDGVDDFLAAPSVDFTNTDQVSVCAGIQKISDAAIGMIAELSSSSTVNDGSFGLWNTSSPSYQFRSRGTISVDVVGNAEAAPHTTVLTAMSDISSDTASVRSMGALIGTSTADQGLGSFGKHSLYLGMRGGSSLPFVGYLYGLVVRNAIYTDDEAAKTEKLLAGKAGVHL